MRKALSIAAKVLALLIFVGAIYCIHTMERTLLRYGKNKVEINAYATYAFFILLPFFSFCMGAAFEKVYAAILVFIFVCAFPLVIIKVIDHLFLIVFPLLRTKEAPVLYYMSYGIRYVITIPIVLACYTLLPHLISSYAIKQGHKVYLLWWGEIQGNPMKPDIQ